MPDLVEPVAEGILSDDADHLAQRLGGVVAEKLRAVHRLLEGIEWAGAEHLHAGARPRLEAVLLHRRTEAVPVEAAVSLRGQRLEQFRRKAIGGVEFRGVATGHHRRPRRADRLEEPLDPLEAAIDRGEKRLLLPLDDGGHAVGRVGELGVWLPHHLGDHRRQRVQKGLPHAHLSAIEHRPPKQPLDDVLLLVVARQHVLVDRKRAGPHVICDPPHPAAVVGG